MKKSKPWLYLPIETKVRELHGKILLASFAAINGFNVVIGSKKDINSRISFLPKGTIFNFGLAKNFAKNAKRHREYGHKVVAIDEEGLVTLNDDLYLRHRVSKEALNVTDMFFCWGKRQASLVEKKAGKTNCKIFIAGNPRLDLLRPEYRVIFKEDSEKIRKKYGKIILINTNFGHGNHFSGDDFVIESFKEKGWMNDADDKKYFLRNIEWQKEMYKKFLEMIPIISDKYKDYNIIIRPHPSENHDAWKKIEKKFSNVSIVHSGNVIPWIMAADVLIHNGCTTAVEAFLLGTKVVAYRPFIVDDLETELPNKISIETRNITELTDTLDKIINKNLDFNNDSKKSYLDFYLADSKNKTDSEEIVSVLVSETNFDGEEINNFSVLFFEISMYLKKIINKILLKSDKNLISSNYQLHKVPNLTESEVREIIKSFSKINNKFLDMQVNKIGDTCHHIYNKS